MSQAQQSIIPIDTVAQIVFEKEVLIHRLRVRIVELEAELASTRQSATRGPADSPCAQEG